MTKATGTSKRGNSRTPTKKVQKETKIGSTDLTEPTSEISNTSDSAKLEEEAKQYRRRKRPPLKPKPMTSRIYLAGQAMAALIIKGQGVARMADVRREAYDWADYMLDDEY